MMQSVKTKPILIVVLLLIMALVMALASFGMFKALKENWGMNGAVAKDQDAVELMLKGEGEKGGFILSLELAATESERSKGLMHRTEMADDHGMLFRFDKTQMVRMWMKNTPLSLDMIFIDENGEVQHIARNTIPQSQKIISSRKPVRYVLEVKAGIAERFGIKRGMRLIHPWFKK